MKDRVVVLGNLVYNLRLHCSTVILCRFVGCIFTQGGSGTVLDMDLPLAAAMVRTVIAGRI